MIRLTPEITLHSQFQFETNIAETRELDFNLARRSAVVVNHIVSTIQVYPDVTSGFEVAGEAVQEIDVDPDNQVIEFQGDPDADDVIMDSSRILRHVQFFGWDTAGGVGHTDMPPILQRDWTNVPINERPISITALRHNFEANGGVSLQGVALASISYFIVELSLPELGLLNASRR